MKKEIENFYKSNFNEINKTVKIFAAIFGAIWFLVFVNLMFISFIYKVSNTEINGFLENTMFGVIWPGVNICYLFSILLFFIHFLVCEKLNLEM